MNVQALSPTDLINLLSSRLARQPFGFNAQKGGINLNLIGVRALPGTPNHFDDCVYAMWQGADGAWIARAFPATTDPGRYWLQNPSRTTGTAILIHDRFYPSIWRIGLHKGEYPALVQNTSRPPPPVWRDNDLSPSGAYGGQIHGDASGINGHHAGQDSTEVEKWSAGCQVIARRSNWDALWSLVEQSAATYGPTFSYALIGLPT